MEEARKKADDKLQMPPILAPRKEIDCVLSKDPVLKGWERENCTHVFADISFGKKDCVCA